MAWLKREKGLETAMFPCSQSCERSNAWAYSFLRQDRPDARFTSIDPNFLHYRHHSLPPFRQTFASDIFCGNLRVITGSARGCDYPITSADR